LGTIARRYNYSMARGWESKSVEAQIEESDSEPSLNANRSSSAEDIQLQMKKSDLELSRKQVLQQLERSDSERYSELLRRTLAGLDAQIAALD
jgi:putative sterol carrier protein